MTWGRRGTPACRPARSVSAHSPPQTVIGASASTMLAIMRSRPLALSSCLGEEISAWCGRRTHVGNLRYARPWAVQARALRPIPGRGVGLWSGFRGITRALGPSWEDLSSGTTAPSTRRRCRGRREARSRALGALRSRPLAARPPVSSSSRSPPAMSVARPGATVHASAPEATVRRDCFRRTDSPKAPRRDRARPPGL